MTYFDKGYKAAKMGLPLHLCRLDGPSRAEWMQGYRSYTPQKTEIIDVVELSDAFAEKHFKTEEDEATKS